MKLYNMGVRGGLKKINKVGFDENRVYLIDDYKTLYLWIGQKIHEKRKDLCINKVNGLNEKRDPPAIIHLTNCVENLFKKF